ncbi:hypothetical protein MMC20_003385 [Loxospora ochrophaea]|nr:hypothetical protein [Loxospora ochrophaea]
MATQRPKEETLAGREPTSSSELNNQREKTLLPELDMTILKEPTLTAKQKERAGILTQFSNVQIKSRAPTIPKIELPRGYGLTMRSFEPVHFHTLRVEMEKLERRKRMWGLGSNISRSRRFGFDPKTLLSTGALSLPNCKPSSLNNKLHPFFHRDRFDDCSDGVYEQLIPGLRLATMFLTTPGCLQYWITAMFGERKDDYEMSSQKGRPCQRISSDVDLTLQNARTIMDHFDFLARNDAIHFIFSPESRRFAWGLTMDNCYGMAIGIKDYKRGYNTTLKEPYVRCQIRLHVDFYITAEKMSRMKYSDTALQLRFNLLLAVNMIHELAHGIGFSLHNANVYQEPFFHGYNDNEAGRTLEKYLLGGRLLPINFRIDCSAGLATWDWPDDINLLEPDKFVHYSVPMSYVSKLQRKEFWQEHSSSLDSRICHIPRDGAQSLYLRGATTMDEAEELRVLAEDFAQLRASADELPASKKQKIDKGSQAVVTKSGSHGLAEAVAERSIAEYLRTKGDEPESLMQRTFRASRNANFSHGTVRIMRPNFPLNIPTAVHRVVHRTVRQRLASSKTPQPHRVTMLKVDAVLDKFEQRKKNEMIMKSRRAEAERIHEEEQIKREEEQEEVQQRKDRELAEAREESAVQRMLTIESISNVSSDNESEE